MGKDRKTNRITSEPYPIFKTRGTLCTHCGIRKANPGHGWCQTCYEQKELEKCTKCKYGLAIWRASDEQILCQHCYSDAIVNINQMEDQGDLISMVAEIDRVCEDRLIDRRLEKKILDDQDYTRCSFCCLNPALKDSALCGECHDQAEYLTARSQQTTSIDDGEVPSGSSPKRPQSPVGSPQQKHKTPTGEEAKQTTKDIDLIIDMGVEAILTTRNALMMCQLKRITEMIPEYQDAFKLVIVSMVKELYNHECKAKIDCMLGMATVYVEKLPCSEDGIKTCWDEVIRTKMDEIAKCTCCHE